MQVTKIALIAVGIISLLSTIMLGVVFYLTMHPPLIEAKMVMVTPSEAAAQRFDDKVEELRRTVSEADCGEEAYFVLTQEEATSKVYQLVTEQDPSTKVVDICINFTNGKLLALLKIDVGTVVSTGVTGAVEIDEDGKLKVVVESVDIGMGATLPPGVREQAASLIPSKDAFTDYICALPLKISQVTMANGELIIRATVVAKSGSDKTPVLLH